MRNILTIAAVSALMAGSAFADHSNNGSNGVGHQGGGNVSGIEVGAGGVIVGGVGVSSTSASGAGGSYAAVTNAGSARSASTDNSASIAGNALTVETQRATTVDNRGNETGINERATLIVTGESFGDRTSSSTARSTRSGNAVAGAGAGAQSEYSANSVQGYAAGGFYGAAGYRYND